MIDSSQQQWSRETISRFWSFHSRNTSSDELCFSKKYDGGLLTLLSELRLLRNKPRLLDFGCGPGHLLERLLPTGVQCWGLDLSAEAVQVTNERHREKSGWHGAQTFDGTRAPFEDRYFDVIVGVEVIEHLLDDDVQTVLSEIWRLLRPGGAVILTTPNNEDLSESVVYCPFCESRFHSVQHVRSFSADSLEHVLLERDFNVELCTAVDLGWLQGSFPPSISDWSLRIVWSWSLRSARRLLDRLLDRGLQQSFTFRRSLGVGPHLIAFAVKPDREPGFGSRT